MQITKGVTLSSTSNLCGLVFFSFGLIVSIVWLLPHTRAEGSNLMVRLFLYYCATSSKRSTLMGDEDELSSDWLEFYIGDHGGGILQQGSGIHSELTVAASQAFRSLHGTQSICILIRA